MFNGYTKNRYGQTYRAVFRYVVYNRPGLYLNQVYWDQVYDRPSLYNTGLSFGIQKANINLVYINLANRPGLR